MKRTVILSILLGCVAMAANARAGQRYSPNVTVGSSSFSGSYGAARASADSNQEIGCYVYTTSQGYVQGACYAEDASGTFKYCNLLNAAPWISQLANITPNTYLYVAFDASGNCTEIETQNSSIYPPVAP